MSTNLQAIGLKLARQFSGSEFAKKYNLNQPAEKLAFESTKNGFQLIEKLIAKRMKDKSPNKKPSSLFDLSLTQEQQMMKDSIEAYAKEEIYPLAHQANEEEKLPDAFMSDIMQLGLNYFSVPDSLGGTAESYSPTTSAIIAEALATADMSLAFAALAPVSVANALAKWGTDEQKNKHLPKYLSDSPIKSAIAVQENTPLFDVNTLNTKARKKGRGFEIDGIKTLVPFNGEASLYLVAAMYKKQPRLFIVPADRAGLKWKASSAMGLKACELGQLRLDKVKLESHALLGGEDGEFNYQQFIDLGQLHWCALAIGTAESALNYLIPYVNERKAFGEPISHRQSVAFMIANIGLELEAMRLMCWRATSLAEQNKPFHKEAFLAHQFCSDKAMEIGTNAVQILGGHGFTKEHPAERWYRDLRILACIHSGLHL